MEGCVQNREHASGLRPGLMARYRNALLRRTVNSAHRQLRGPFSPREKDTPPGREVVRVHGWAKVEQCRSNCREPRRGQAVEDEGQFFPRFVLSPTLSTLVPNFVLPPPSMESSRREREKNRAHYLVVGLVTSGVCQKRPE